MPSFDNPKNLKFVITLATGTFGSSSANTITLQGYRANVEITKAGGQMMGELRAQIYGVSQSDMNSATTLQWKPSGLLLKNTISVYAIDGAQTTLVFQGNIINAWGNYQSMPDVFLQIQASSTQYNQLLPIAPTVFKGSVNVATVMAQLASKMGYTFENNGVSVLLSNPYLANTGIEQAFAAARAANIDLVIDNGVLAITPPNAPRNGSQIPVVSAATGLKGYPLFDGIGVTFDTEFNPAIQFKGAFKLVTDIQQAAGQWVAGTMSYRLQGNTPGGAWFATVRGNANGLVIRD